MTPLPEEEPPMAGDRSRSGWSPIAIGRVLLAGVALAAVVTALASGRSEHLAGYLAAASVAAAISLALLVRLGRRDAVRT